MIRIFITLLICALTFSAEFLQAKDSYIVLERHSRRVLLASGSEEKRPIASLSHIVTAKVVTDWAKAAGVSSSSLVTVPQHNLYSAVLNPLALQAGDQISLRDALYSLLLGEDSVAATTLAHYVGQDLLKRRQLGGSPVEAFVAEMNNLAKSLGMLRSGFKLPSGIDTLESNSYSTASDIARLTVSLANDSALGFYVKQRSRDLKVTKADGSVATLTVLNSNKLLASKLKVVGMKAGFSAAASQCLSILADKDSYVEKLADDKKRVTPVQLVVVVLGSSNAGSVSKNLIPQGWSQYEAWRETGYLTAPDRRKFLKLPTAR